MSDMKFRRLVTTHFEVNIRVLICYFSLSDTMALHVQLFQSRQELAETEKILEIATQEDYMNRYIHIYIVEN